MKWTNLKSNKCPACNKFLRWDEAGNLYCQLPCTFLVSQAKFRAIVSSQINKSLSDEELEEKLQQEEDNL